MNLHLAASNPAAYRDEAGSAPSTLSAPCSEPGPRRRMPDAHIGWFPNDRGFVAMLQTYRPTGGIMRGDDLARLFQHHRRGDVTTLAKSIVAQEIFGFYWAHEFWVPMCQFDLSNLSIKQALRQVRSELPKDMDGWVLAAWLAEPNAWLMGLKPVDLLDTDPPALLRAARADHMIAQG